jgi:hypothetical protein
MPASPDARSIGRLARLLLVYAACLVLGGGACLTWLLWRAVPVHEALFEGLGVPLPRTTLVTFAAATWLVRLAPFLVMLGVGLAGGLAIAFLNGGARKGRPWVVSALISAGLAVGVLELTACAFACWSIHHAYEVNLGTLDDCSHGTGRPR